MKVVAVVIIALLVAIPLALLNSLVIWALWDDVIPAVVPGLVSRGIVPADITFATAFWFSLLTGAIFRSATPSTTNNS